MLKLVSAFEGHDERVWNVCWNFTGQMFASCGSDKNIRLWKCRHGDSDSPNCTWDCISVLSDGHTRTVRSYCFSPCGRYLASTSFDATLSFGKKTESDWEMKQTLEGHENEVKCACWSPSGQYLATCSRDKSVWVWAEVDEDEDFQCCSILQNHSQDVKCVRWHTTHDFLASCGYDDTIRFYTYDGEDWVTTQCINKAHRSTVWDMAFDTDGDKLVSCSQDKTLKIWQRFPLKSSPDKGKWESVCTVAGGYHDGPIYSVDWCPLTGNIASGCSDNAIRIFKECSRELWDSPECLTFNLIQTVHSAHKEDVNCVRWNRKIQGLLCSASDDGQVKLWQLENWN